MFVLSPLRESLCCYSAVVNDGACSMAYLEILRGVLGIWDILMWALVEITQQVSV